MSAAALPAVPVAAIGASAGGVEALVELFGALPADTGFAFVVIVHLDPGRDSELVPILARAGALDVREASGDDELVPNGVLVIPPGRALSIADGRLVTEPFDAPRGRRLPIDTFFRSFAAQVGDGVAVVLSGDGADGASGVRDVKEAGGLVLVQEPPEAAFDAMPRATIATGTADLVLPLAELAARLGDIARSKRQLRERLEAAPDADGGTADAALKHILEFVHGRTGQDFGRYKRATVIRRVARRMQITRQETFETYLAFLREHAGEAQALFDDLLISVTAFFRDPDAWQALAERVVPALFDERAPDEPVRVWVPGCASGEEAYTLAMLLIEEAERRERWPEVQVFASDLDEAALATAREGRYARAIAADVDEARLERFFVRDGEGYRVGKALRDCVLFTSHSLLRDPPFIRLDLISCRNLLIYLERDLQGQVFGIFRYALKPDGKLFLGSAESADPDHFVTLDKRQRLYRLRATSVPLPLPDLVASGPRPRMFDLSGLRTSGSGPRAATHDELESLAPPSALVDARGAILRLHEGAGRYLQPPDGTPTRELAVSVRPALRAPLRAALGRALEDGEGSLSGPIAVALDGGAREVSLWVRPRVAEGRDTRALVVFVESEGSRPGEPAAGDGGADDSEDGRERRLREELSFAERRLQESGEARESAAEEVRAIGEELQSVHEEYRSTAEELETGKEELQSINEELNTVNAELKRKLDEVSRARDDLENLMAATEIGTLFLDRGLAIQRFTPVVGELFNVAPGDLGRPIGDFTHHLDYDTLVADARTAIASLVSVEREARHADGRGFAVRLRPYRTADDRIDGVVVTFVDVTARQSTERALRDSEARLNAVLAAGPAVPFAADADGRMSYVGPGIREHAGIEPEAVQGSALWETLLHPDDRAHAEAAWIEARRSGTPYEARHRLGGDGGSRWVITRARAVLDEDGGAHEWLGVITDVDELTRAERALREADARRGRFLGLLGHELRNPLAAITNGLAVLSGLGDEARRAAEAGGVPIGRTLDGLERQSGHMTRLIDDLLDLTRIDNNKIALRRRALPLERCLESSLDALRPRLADAELTLSLTLPEEPLTLDADVDRVAQMLDNLLDNAIKYTPSGGRIELHASRDGERALLALRDDGVGIAPEMLSTLFDPFTQVAVTSTGRGWSGLGLGLALVRSLAALHGGSIEARSAGLGRGSEFLLRLPLASESTPPADADAEGTAGAEPSGAAADGGRRLLVVDDSADIADPFAALLRVAGFEVRVAYDGAAALELVTEFEPSVAFLDLGMPGMNGLELARTLRRDHPAGTLVLVAVTGYGQGRDIEATDAAGFDHHLLKPVRMQDVRTLLRSLE